MLTSLYEKELKNNAFYHWKKHQRIKSIEELPPSAGLTRWIPQSEAKFRVGDYVVYEGRNRRVLEIVEKDGTGRYCYRLEGVEGLVDEALLQKVPVPPPRLSVGETVILKVDVKGGYIVVDCYFDFERNKWRYELEEKPRSTHKA